MADIIRAIEKEKEYLAYRMNGKEPFHLVDVIKEYGFETLDEYFCAKKKYEFSNLSFTIIDTVAQQAITEVMKVISEKKTAVLFADTEHTLIWNGNNSQFNEDYCVECNIPVYPLQTNGGTIVSTIGDLNIGICVPQSIGIDAQFILNGFSEIFRKYTDKTIDIDKNDILINGYKVLGSSVYNINGMFMFITPVSLSEKSELISHICIKHSVKQPGHIDFMDGAMLRQEVSKWLLERSI